MEPADGAPDAFQRKIQGRCPSPEGITVYFLNKKTKKNEGEVPQYYVEGNHEAIINPTVFDMVQAELEKRKQGRFRYSGVSIFSNKIKCADCGEWFGSKVWHSTDKYRRVIYRCNSKYKDKKCETPYVTEEEVKAAFLSVYNKLVFEKEEIVANAETIRETLCWTDALEEEKRSLENGMAVLAGMVQSIDENARIVQNQGEYNGLVERYDTTKEQYDEVARAITEKEAQNERLAGFINILKAQDGIITEFDERLWSSMVDYITVGRNKEMVVTFQDGTEITV